MVAAFGAATFFAAIFGVALATVVLALEPALPVFAVFDGAFTLVLRTVALVLLFATAVFEALAADDRAAVDVLDEVAAGFLAAVVVRDTGVARTRKACPATTRSPRMPFKLFSRATDSL